MIFLFTIQHLIWLTIFLINLQLNDKDTNLKHEFDIFFILSISLLRTSLICFKTIHHFQLIYFICLLVFDVKMRFFYVTFFYWNENRVTSRPTITTMIWVTMSKFLEAYLHCLLLLIKNFIVISKHVCDY